MSSLLFFHQTPMQEHSASSDAGRSPSPTQTLPRKPMKVPRKPAAATPVQPVAQQVQPQQMASSEGMQTSQSICDTAKEYFRGKHVSFLTPYVNTMGWWPY